ncbi:hypothetical protein ACEZCY_15160 [Streptacidiphilus sp. N1-12]|uniref:Uncharacterized protein n=2 Tax=Streptacidiphilus alkalitolerans TaxID=3342712 RepID=A0ABV6VBJ1_9ACTN
MPADAEAPVEPTAPAEPDAPAYAVQAPAEPAAPAYAHAPTDAHAPADTDAPSGVRRRPRGRTALIMAAAVVLGVLGGGGAGYAVQAARKPTPLPSLAVAQPKYPAKRVAIPALPAAQDDQVKTDGDLTKLLVPAPAGVKANPDRDAIDNWLDLADFAETFVKPGVAFSHQAEQRFRRAAEAGWDKGPESTTVFLVQYADGDTDAARSEMSDQESYGHDATGGTAVDVPHTIGGEVFPGQKKLGGSDPYYEGRGYAQHGDISVEIFVDSAHPVSAKTLLTLLQSQLERL